MSQAFRVLRIEFESQQALAREYAENLVHGGLFVPGRAELLYGEPVLVFADLPFAGTSLELEGRVAQCIPPEFAADARRAGVAIELSSPAEEIRQRLEALTGTALADDEEAGRDRVAPRTVAYTRARVQLPDGTAQWHGRTRNLSLAGALIALEGELPTVGQPVRVAIVHPTSGEEREIEGVVARHDRDDSGHVCGIGVQFQIAPSEAQEAMRYLGRVKASEHARRLGGIHGTLDVLGLEDLLTSFGQFRARGRFTLTQGGQVGTIFVERGAIESVQVGSASGLEALARLLEWDRGSFEFHADGVPESDGAGLSLPIEAALLDAARLLDESRRSGAPA